MSRLSIATPCPAPTGLPIPSFNKRLSTNSLDSTQDDNTADIDFTRAIDVGLKNARPRRRSAFHKVHQKEAPITIFEDVVEDQELVVEPRKRLGGTLLARPAQKPPMRAPVTSIGEVRRRDTVECSASLRSTATVPSNAGRPQSASIAQESTAQQDVKKATGLKKEPRRRTIFVPDDTTVLTIHPGASTTNGLNDTFQLPEVRSSTHGQRAGYDVGVRCEEARQPRRPRLSMTVAPKRLPLASVADPNVGNTTGIDVAGQNGGKENMPPNGLTAQGVDDSKKSAPGLLLHRSAAVNSSLNQPTAASRSRQSMAARDAAPLSKSFGNAIKSLQTAGRGTFQSLDQIAVPAQKQYSPLGRQISVLQHKHPSQKATTQTSQANIDHVHNRPRSTLGRPARLPQYPVLSEDLAQPELYEDSWLNHQEIALTEVINRLFENAEASKPIESSVSLRERLIGMYHQPTVTRLYKRLQASLLYGALSRPKDVPGPPDPARDIGLRRRVLSLWLDSYNQDVLQAAAEVVFGHRITSRTSDAVASNTLDPHRCRRQLAGFLETFLVDVEDVEHDLAEYGEDNNPRWRKMVIRSLMLVWLLDQASTESSQDCLFRATSSRKSSAAIVQGLASMLIPSIGDVLKVLRHLDYEVIYIQDPLDEVRYRIGNMALDLRDGVLLTRLVEILLFSPRNLKHPSNSSDATITVQMPDLTILESALCDNRVSTAPRILSRHLKMPCIGRAQKAYNVDIALSALRDHGRLGHDVSEVSADDIVNGHREKSLGLLWSLVSTYGLDHLVDFRELAADIRRSPGANADVQAVSFEDHSPSQLQYETLLKKWASCHCAGQGVRIGNLTTSFADGKAYAAIVDDFKGYTSDAVAQSKSSSDHQRLQDQLRSLGCSTAFIKQLTASGGAIQSRRTTLSNLAFLASRLLPLARRHRAAEVIQRAFRHRRSKILVSRRVVLMRLAHDCATVVQNQQKVERAATLIQQTWRRVLDCRIDKLNNDVSRLQCLAKGRLVRRRLHQQRSVQSHMVMAGW
jgi:abnormal spindle-like microcephaly-associated protein